MLSASQLEQKRANDREAQRAIRQRMKKHIESLETTVGKLRGSQESTEKIVAVTQQRKRDLEAEIAYLRTKFHEGGHEAEAPLMDGLRQFGEGVLSTHLTSRVNLASATSLGIKRPTSISTSRNLSVATGSTGSWYGSFQKQSSFLPSALTSAVTMPDQKSAGEERCLVWGPHDTTSSGHTMQAPPPQVQEPLRPDLLLRKLNGLPLALTQAGAYIGRTGVDVPTYIRHFDGTWSNLVRKQDRFPLQEYAEHSMLTTWKISYEQMSRQSKAAASLLKLWAFFSPDDVWHGLIASALEV
ncbi:hypothetical protein LTR56_027709 [Elasticomyces elasticus]|nr:hypothetical protein LTR56_027709 [Elasticomyces elasticus]KAK3614396.1 hypothetical protein LTR22_027797 [Elasticomyces elasticus]